MIVFGGITKQDSEFFVDLADENDIGTEGSIYINWYRSRKVARTQKREYADGEGDSLMTRPGMFFGALILGVFSGFSFAHESKPESGYLISVGISSSLANSNVRNDGARRVPSFDDYLVSVPPRRPNAPIQLLTSQDRMYRTRLTELSRQPPNFAGRLALGTWGCGRECEMGAAVDTHTGRVFWLPGSICCVDSMQASDDDPIDYTRIRARLNSSLLILTGFLNEENPGIHYFRFTGSGFELLRHIPIGEGFF